jgi:hypothetical protein
VNAPIVKPRALPLLMLAALPFLASASDGPPVHLVCAPKPLVCMGVASNPDARFDPLIQQLMVKQQLDAQPKGWSVIFLYVPDSNTRELEEMQIRLLEELLSRERATAK